MPSNLFVVLMGLGTVFFGLICLIVLTYVMCAALRPKNAPAPAPAPVAPAVPAPAAVEAVPNRQAMVAAIAAAIAEDLGTDVSGIRILSIKKL